MKFAVSNMTGSLWMPMGALPFSQPQEGGYAPKAFLSYTDAFDAVIGAILASPPTTTARFESKLPERVTNTWKLMAERGIFAFDSDCNGGPYRLIAAPEIPASVTVLPPETVSVVNQIVLQDLRLRVASVIPASVLADACERPRT